MNNSRAISEPITRQQIWDERFLSMAQLVSTWSKDPSTKVGAVIVTPENLVISVGYNGFAKRMPDAAENYADRKAKYSRIVHAETNAILFARGDVRGFTLYCTFPPCDRCAVQIIQAGIARVVCPQMVEGEAAARWREFFETARKYFNESGVVLVEV